MFDFSGKVVLVTGAASGLGLDCAAAFVEAGAQVMLTDVQVELGLAAAGRLGEKAAFLEHDVRDESRWQQVVQETVERFGGLNVLVNAAGIALYAGIEDTSLAQFRNIHAVNVEGVFLGCKNAIPAMRQSGGGSIINLSSTAGLRGVGKLTAYCSAKGAVRMLTKSVAVECAEKGDNIRCNSLHPSYTDTPMVQGSDQPWRRPRAHAPASGKSQSDEQAGTAARGVQCDPVPGLGPGQFYHRCRNTGGRRHHGTLMHVQITGGPRSSPVPVQSSARRCIRLEVSQRRPPRAWTWA